MSEAKSSNITWHEGHVTREDREKRLGQRGVTIWLNAGDDLQIPLDRVEGAGGKILQPKESIGEFGFIAMILDTEGNRIGLHSPN